MNPSAPSPTGGSGGGEAARRPRVEAARWALAAGLCLGGGLMPPSALYAAGPTTGPTTAPAAAPATSPAPADAQTLLEATRDLRLDPLARCDAAIRLLDSDEPNLVTLLQRELHPSRNVTTQRAIAQALVARAEEPPEELGATLFALLDRPDEALQEDVAAALGRYRDHRLARRLIDLALDASAPVARRRGAALTIGHFPSQNAARVLMQLAQPPSPPAVVAAAYSALGQLTGLSDPGRDPAKWQKWWEQNRRRSEEEFLEEVLANQARRVGRQNLQLQAMQERVLEAQRQLYRATAKDDRPALLAAMLRDPLEAVRRSALALMFQRLVDNERPGKALLGALTERLDDPSAAVRRSAAMLLRDAGDAAGADAVAKRLQDEAEPDQEVVKAYLLVMASQPRAAAVPAAAALLGDARVRSEAAAALTRAIDAGLIDVEGSQKLARRVRDLVAASTPAAPPEPAVIELLGRLASEADWRRIDAWLDDSQEGVRLAAAQAWAQSSRPLEVLARRAGDRVVLPVLIAAAQKRGDDPVTMLALARNKPAAEQLSLAWQRALTAMASRVGGDAVLAVDRVLARQAETPALRLALVNAVMTKLLAEGGGASPAPTATAPTTRPAATPPPPGVTPAVWGDLLLTSAELHLDQNDTILANADLQRVDPLAPASVGAPRLRWLMAMLRVSLGGNDAEGVISYGRQALALEPGDPVTRGKAVALMVESAQRLLTAGQAGPAGQVVRAVREGLGAGGQAEWGERLAELDRKTGAAMPNGTGAAGTAPATSAATSTAPAKPMPTPASMPAAPTTTDSPPASAPAPAATPTTAPATAPAPGA